MRDKTHAYIHVYIYTHIYVHMCMHIQRERESTTEIEGQRSDLANQPSEIKPFLYLRVKYFWQSEAIINTDPKIEGRYRWNDKIDIEL